MLNSSGQTHRLPRFRFLRKIHRPDHLGPSAREIYASVLPSSPSASVATFANPEDGLGAPVLQGSHPHFLQSFQKRSAQILRWRNFAHHRESVHDGGGFHSMSFRHHYPLHPSPRMHLRERPSTWSFSHSSNSVAAERRWGSRSHSQNRRPVMVHP